MDKQAKTKVVSMKFTKHFAFMVGLVSVLVLSGSLAAQHDDWASWRGPNGNGVADGQKPPVVWDDEHNVVWKVAIPGRGHASPLIVGDKIFLATADVAKETQSLVCLTRDGGDQVWETLINEGGFPKRIHENNTHASSTPTCDGEHVFVVFNHHDSVSISSIDLSGKIAWTKKVGDYKPMFPFGFAGSPVLYENLVIAINENEADSAMVAFDRKTGEEVWRATRGGTSYSSPVVAHIGGRDQLLVSGGKTIVSHNPSTGELFWSLEGPWDVTCGTMVWDKASDLVFASGGYPASRTYAINPNGDGEIVWENGVKFYEQSMLCHDGYVYGLSDRGVMYCWQAIDGKEMWKHRLKSPVSASPVWADGNLHISIQDGTTFVIKASPDKFELVAENKLGNQAFSTPAIIDHRIFARVGQQDGDTYQEWLYCIGSE